MLLAALLVVLVWVGRRGSNVRALGAVELLRSKGSASQVELTELVGSDDAVSLALAPVASLIRVEADDDGQLRYVLEEPVPENARSKRADC